MDEEKKMIIKEWSLCFFGIALLLIILFLLLSDSHFKFLSLQHDHYRFVGILCFGILGIKQILRGITIREEEKWRLIRILFAFLLFLSMCLYLTLENPFPEFMNPILLTFIILIALETILIAIKRYPLKLEIFFNIILAGWLFFIAMESTTFYFA